MQTRMYSDAEAGRSILPATRFGPFTARSRFYSAGGPSARRWSFPALHQWWILQAPMPETSSAYHPHAHRYR